MPIQEFAAQQKGMSAMTAKERQEHRKLRHLWMVRRATMKQMMRCMDLDRKADYEARLARKGAAK